MIGKSVKELLSNLSEMFGDKIFPVTAPQGINQPFIVYAIVGLSNTASKEDTIMDEVEVDIVVYARTYEVVQSSVQQVRTIVEKFKGVSAGIYISDVELGNYTDGYDPKYERFLGIMTFHFYVDANYQS